IKAPNRYASELHREETRARRDWILRRMREAGALDHKEFARARGTSIRLGAKIPSITGGHFVDMVRREGREQHAVSRSAMALSGSSQHSMRIFNESPRAS